MATASSQAGGLLVVREQRSNLPNLAKQGKFSPENVMLVAQMQGETYAAFASRVLGRCQRAVTSGQGLRAVSFCVDADVGPDELAARRALLLEIVKLLAARPASELLVCAPPRLASADQVALFEMAEVALRAVPSMNIRIHFADAPLAGTSGRRPPTRARQPAAA